jgi:aquaporin Z
MAGVAVGAVIALEALFAGPICGASMNPARSLAPAGVSGILNHLWLYLTAPVLGAAPWPSPSAGACMSNRAAAPTPRSPSHDCRHLA